MALQGVETSHGSHRDINISLEHISVTTSLRMDSAVAKGFGTGPD